MTNQQVGAWVKRRMDARKWSVTYVSEMSGIARTTIYDLINGVHPPSVDTQRALAGPLEVEVGWYDELLAGREPADVTPQPAGDPLVVTVQLLAQVVRRLCLMAEIEMPDLPLPGASNGDVPARRPSQRRARPANTS